MCKSVWKNAVKGVCWLILVTFVYTATAQARVCFLPGGKCPGAPLANTLKGIQGDQCLGYNLTQIKCKDQACEIGWDCESCTNAQGTFYKCTKKPTPPGFTPGLEKCPSPCQQYTWDGFTGNQINGKCESIPDYTPTKPNPCRTYITPDYTCGASISGADVGDLTKENGGCQVCYTNIVEMSGYTTTKPASCTTYNSKRNGLGSSSDTMCYTSGTSIGEHFTTAERDSDVFIIETKYGVDTFIALSGAQTKKNTEACYRATGCNTANGWLKSTDVDGNKFEYLEKSSDGIVCRKAVACKESNNWFNHEKLGQYKNKHFSTTEETRSGLTCYRAGGCHTKAYTAQPDARYFKFDKKTSNSYNCWIVTGKADYAYNAGDKKTNMFDYTSATVYLNGTDTQVTYWIVNKDNGRNGCMQYAYESQPDTKYFTSVSAVQYSNGSSTTKTCWNITGKAAYAYNTGDRKTNFFDYTSATGYLNGTATQVTYWIVNKDNGWRGCMQYAYENQPDASYFASTSATHYSNGSSTTKTCWNATGKAPYVYAANEKQTAYFTYDSGATAYLNGTSTTGTYYKVTGCASGASTSSQDTAIFTVGNNTLYKNGTSTTIKCYRATGCAITGTKPGACKTYSTSTQSGVTCYYGISTTGASDCTTSPDSCYNYTSGKDTNGNTVYYSAKKKTCTEGGYYTSSQATSCSSSGYKTTSSSVSYCGNSCFNKTTNVACSCSDGGYYTSSQNSGCSSSGYKVTGSSSTTYGGKTCYTSGSSSACSCSDGGYSSSCSNGSCSSSGYYDKCKSTTYGGKTCYYTSSTACSCSDGGYVSSCTEGCATSNSEVTCSSKTYGGRTCYSKGTKYCSTGQACYNGSCKTCIWPGYNSYDANNCMTVADGTVSDGCGNTQTNYKSKCSSGQRCNGSGSCVACSYPASYAAYNTLTCMTVENGTVSDGCGNSKTTYKSKCTSGTHCNGAGKCIADPVCGQPSCSATPQHSYLSTQTGMIATGQSNCISKGCTWYTNSCSSMIYANCCC